jgi:hypothetical protein
VVLAMVAGLGGSMLVLRKVFFLSLVLVMSVSAAPPVTPTAPPTMPPGTILGGSVGNGGNGGEGQMQWAAAHVLLPCLSFAENRKILTDTELAALTKLIEGGIPFSPVVPTDLPAGRFSDSRGVDAVVKNGRMLDNQGTEVDARVVWDRVDKTYVIQWEAKAWERSSTRGQAYPEALVRDIAHEISRYAFFSGAITRNDDRRVISNRLKLRGGAPVRHLPSDSYRMDLPRRAKEISALMERVMHIMETDLKGHAESAGRLVQLRADTKRLKEFDHGYWPNTDEELAENFDDVHRNLLDHLGQLEFQKRIALMRKTPTTKPANAYDFARRVQWMEYRLSRLNDLLQWNASIRDTAEGRRWTADIKNAWQVVAAPFDRNAVRMSDAQFAQWLDGSMAGKIRWIRRSKCTGKDWGTSPREHDGLRVSRLPRVSAHPCAGDEAGQSPLVVRELGAPVGTQNNFFDHQSDPGTAQPRRCSHRKACALFCFRTRSGIPFPRFSPTPPLQT